MSTNYRDLVKCGLLRVGTIVVIVRALFNSKELLEPIQVLYGRGSASSFPGGSNYDFRCSRGNSLSDVFYNVLPPCQLVNHACCQAFMMCIPSVWSFITFSSNFSSSGRVILNELHCPLFLGVGLSKAA